MRLAHLKKFAERIGIDKMLFCSNEEDAGVLDEFNFDGLMNEPWYDRIKGNEMRSLFRTEKTLEH